jgi:predicted enzyme related to lactoylglutathione lyase
MAEHGTFMWNELMTADVDGSKAFYASVLGWTFQEMNIGAGPYNVAMVGDAPAGGIFKMDGPQFAGQSPQWMAYIKVDDVDAIVGKVEAAGGKVLQPPFDVPTVGRIAMIADPVGAAVGIMTPVDNG